MATNSFGIQKLTPSEVTRIFGGMSPQKATRYYNRCMTNPDTPQENISLLRQYREQNPQRFLSEEQMRGNRGQKGSWIHGRGYSGGFRERGQNVFDSDGFSYDGYGNRYDPRGNNTAGFHDGGSEAFQGHGQINGFSNYYGAANQRPRGYRGRRSRPISDPRSYEELSQTLLGLSSDVARTRYFMKVVRNPETNPDTLNNLVRLRNNNPGIFVSDEEAIAAGPMDRSTGNPGGNGRGNGRGGFWSSFWKPKDEFDSMSPKKKKFFVGAVNRRDRAKNTAYGLRVLTNPTTSPEDKVAMTEVVNENPRLFFSRDSPAQDNGQRYREID